MQRILPLTSLAITKITLLQSIYYVSKQLLWIILYCPEHILLLRNSCVINTHTHTQPLSPTTTIDSDSQQLHLPRVQHKKGIGLRMHIQLQLYEKACKTVQQNGQKWVDFMNHCHVLDDGGQIYLLPLKHPQRGPP